jgi:H+/Cl- antiporter ClcA
MERVKQLGQWIALGAVVGVACGIASAGFLYALAWATDYREAHTVIIWALPIAGFGIGWLYDVLGKPIARGTNLIIDTLHDGGPRVPLRMAPMVLVGTVLTHLFGGSAGREGTAVQMGASLADAIGHRFSPALRRQLLAAGIAGGFGSVFGTPIAGAVFGLEVVVIGAMEYDALAPALVAAIVGDLVTRGLGIVHTPYPALHHVAIDPLLCAKWIVFAAAIAAAANLFIELTHRLKAASLRIKWPALRMAAGGLLVVGAWQALGTTDELGLGIPTILRAFSDPHLPGWVFAVKLVLTAITLGAGFLGGEVTPLFFIGAALGNLLAQLLGIPIELGAGVGMAAMFACASNTPLALSIMAVELLGGAALPHVLIVSALAYLFSGKRTIYPAQRLRRA